MTNPRLTISGFDIEFDLAKGLNLWAGTPTLSMWIPNTVAGLMAGLAEMVGTERFNLCLQLGGQQSVDGDWAVISSAPTFEEGMKAMATIAWPAGWGKWELVALDRENREARYRVVNGWEALYQRALGVRWGSAMVAGKFAGITARLFGVPCWAEQTAFASDGAPADEFVVRPTERTAEGRMDELLEAGRGTHADLAIALQRLKKEIAERESTEQELRAKLDLIQRQERSLRQLAAPVLEVWPSVLAVPVVGALDREAATDLRGRLLHAIQTRDTQSVILDLTGVTEVDTTTADLLLRIIRSVELVGARVVVTGINPSVAETVVAIGIDLAGIVTRRNLKEGLVWCLGPSGRAALSPDDGAARDDTRDLDG